MTLSVDTPAERATDPRRRTRPWRRRALLLVLGAALAAAALTASFGTYRVTSGSMSPTLRVGDRMLVDKVSHHLSGIHRGDIVVFRDPGGWVDAERRVLRTAGSAPRDALLVKRVVAVGGDRVSCCADHRFELDGRALREGYLPTGQGGGSLGFDRQVPAGQLFVVGDDREDSLDSRALTGVPGRGLVPESAVVGTVVSLPVLSRLLDLHP